MWTVDPFLIFSPTQNREQLWVKEELFRREIPPSSSKEGREQSFVPVLYTSTVLLPGADTYLLGQHHGPSAECVCLSVPQGGQSPHYGMRQCPERNENPAETKTATWK